MLKELGGKKNPLITIEADLLLLGEIGLVSSPPGFEAAAGGALLQ